MFLVGGLFLGLAIVLAVALGAMLKRGGFARLIALGVVAYIVYLFLAWQLPYWTN